MSHTVRYGRVTFTQVETKRFSQEIQYDESDTDFLYHNFRIRIAGSVHADQLHFHRTVVDGLADSTAAQTMATIQAALMHPRQLFEYQVGSDIMVRAEAVAGSDDLDMNNGPKPVACDIVHVVGQKLFRVEFEIVCSIRRCGNVTQAQQIYGAKRDASVLNNRWSVTDQKDANFYTTRTIEGTLRVGHISFWPHMFRYLCVPPLQKGYKREVMRFADTPDGLTLRYQIVDRQKFRAAPSPAVDWDATYTESTGEGGAIGFGEMRIKLFGAQDSPTFKLLEVAAQILFERMGDLTRTYAGKGDGEYSVILRHLVIAERLNENEIEMNARIQRASSDQKFLNATIAKIGQPLELSGYDPKRWPVPKLYDSATPSGMFAKYLQSSCDDIHGVPQLRSMSPRSDDSGEDDVEPTEVQFFEDPEPIPEDDQSGINQEVQTAGFPYTHFLIENKYRVDRGWLQLPVARWDAAPATRTNTAALIRVHAPVAQRHIFIHAERVGDWPSLPDPDATLSDRNGIRMELAEFVPLLDAPELLPDGKSRIFRAQAKYIYLMARAPTASEILGVGSDPRDVSTPEENALEGNISFSQDGILE